MPFVKNLVIEERKAVIITASYTDGRDIELNHIPTQMEGASIHYLTGTVAEQRPVMFDIVNRSSGWWVKATYSRVDTTDGIHTEEPEEIIYIPEGQVAYALSGILSKKSNRVVTITCEFLHVTDMIPVFAAVDQQQDIPSGHVIEGIRLPSLEKETYAIPSNIAEKRTYIVHLDSKF